MNHIQVCPQNSHKALNSAITGQDTTGEAGEIPESPITQIRGFPRQFVGTCETCSTKFQKGCIYPDVLAGAENIGNLPACLQSIFNDRTLELSSEEKTYLARQEKTLRMSAPERERSIKFRKWRKRNGIKRCNGCGKRLTTEPHHTLCNKCWESKQAGKR